jgi:carboxylate-amine ligase
MSAAIRPSNQARRRVPSRLALLAAGRYDAGEATNLGAEEEFHVVDRDTRELVARGPQLLRRLPADAYSAELHRSVVESNTPVCTSLADLRRALVRSRQELAAVAGAEGLGVVAAGTVPLVDPLRLAITSNSRYERMLEDYQLLVREQLICGAQVHVQLSDRDVAVAVAQRLSPYLPILLALSASSPFWMAEDSGYASMRSLIWQRWPTAGLSGEVSTAAEHDALVADLVASNTITDAGMIYFDVRPSAHVPTIELRVTDACPDLDTVVLIAGLFRALVRRERDDVLAGVPVLRRPAPVLRAAMWRAARSGLEGDLLDLPRSPRPVPAATAVSTLLSDLRSQLEATGDWSDVRGLAGRALAGGSSAAEQRRTYQRRGRLADVVDLLLARTSAGAAPVAADAPALAHPLRRDYVSAGDEMLTPDGTLPEYVDMLAVFDGLGPVRLRQREIARDEEQRSQGVTFGVPGEASTRLFPVDLMPRIVPAADWSLLQAGVAQRARALDAFLHDVYGDRAVVADGVIPAWVVAGAPGLRPTGALMHRQRIRATVCGMDLVRDGRAGWYVLEDNVRVPSGLGYAVQNRRLTRAVMPDLPAAPGLLDVEAAPELLRAALTAAAPAAAGDDPGIVLLSEGPEGSAWFEHRMLGEEMGVPVLAGTDLLVEDGRVYRLRQGARRPVDVVYLRMDEDALLHASAADGRPLGPPLLKAVDAGLVALANAPGNGVGDDKAIYSFVPQLIEYYLGEQALLASVPTYLCGVAEQRDAVLDRLDELVCKPVDGYGGEGVLIGPSASDEELGALRRQIVATPHRWIAQETVGLSTHPTFDGTRLEPRHVDLRAFVFLGEEPVVAPAALTRVAPPGSMVVNSSRGGGSKDTWLLG